MTIFGFLAKRLLQATLTILVAVLVVFVAVRLLPNNPVLARFGQHAVPEQVAKEMAKQGWDRPILQQMGSFVKDLVTTGNLGDSFFETNEPVVRGLARTFPATVELALVAMLIALPVGIGAGMAAAYWRNRFPDVLCMSGSLIGTSVPVFFLGICMMSLLQGMPTGRRLPPGSFPDSATQFFLVESLFTGRWGTLGTGLRHICLPALALSTIPTAVIARITRSAMLDVLSSDYIRTARAKGESERRVVLRHAFPNAAIPISNIGSLQLGQLLSGAVLTESVFDWPGLGKHLVNAVVRSDYNVVQGATILITLTFVALNLGMDVLYAVLDPRLRHAETGHG